MSSLLLSQSIISSAENSLREKSLQRKQQQQQHLNFDRYNNRNYRKNDQSSTPSSSFNQYHHRHRLSVTDLNDNQFNNNDNINLRKSSFDDMTKFCWLIFISILVLIFYLLIFAFISLICYVLFIWIPNDIERNKLNNELYNSIVDERQNMILMAQLPQYDRKILITKNLYVFESKQNEDLMNLASKPSLLKDRYPALFWNEDFRSIIKNEQISGAIWLNNIGDIIFVFISPINETAIGILRFQPSINHITYEIKLIDSNESHLPISSVDPGTEINLVQLKNGKSMRVDINLGDNHHNGNEKRYLCFNNINDTLKKINLCENMNCCTNESIQWPHFNVGYGNGTSLHLFSEKNQKILIVPENVLFRLGVEYQFEFIEITQLLTNRLFPLIGDWIIVAIASVLLFSMIIIVLKYMIKRKHYQFSDIDNNNNTNNNNHHHHGLPRHPSTIMEESYPLLKQQTSNVDNSLNDDNFKWLNLLFCWSKSSNNQTDDVQNNNSDRIRESLSVKKNSKNYDKI